MENLTPEEISFVKGLYQTLGFGLFDKRVLDIVRESEFAKERMKEDPKYSVGNLLKRAVGAGLLVYEKKGYVNVYKPPTS